MATVTINPNGPGSETSIYYTYGSANHWENVLGTPDTFNWSPHDSGGTRDLYSLGDTGISTGVIHRIKVYVTAGGWEGWGANASIKNSGYGVHDYSLVGGCATLDTNPDTGLPWTWAQLDSMEAGAIIYAGSGVGNDVMLLRVYVVVEYTVAPPSISKYNGTGLEVIAKINSLSLASVAKVNGVG